MSFWNEQSVAITGGAGFLGSYLVDECVAAGARVTAIDNLSSGTWKRITHHGDEVRRIECDVRERQFVDRIAGHSVILNAAGLASGLCAGPTRHDLLFDGNLAIARAVRAAALSADVEHYLEISSSCVYPDDAPVPTPEMELEDTQPEAVNRGYGSAKRRIEAEIQDVAAQHPGFNLTVVRPFNLFGTRDWGLRTHANVIPALIQRFMQSDREILVWGDGKQTRSFTHAKDAARAMLQLLEHHPNTGPVNIGRNAEISMQELAEAINRMGGFEKEITFDPSKPTGASRKACDPARLLKLLPDFTFNYDTKAGLEEMVREYR
jgi:nucleoside-diphosphate-sugar epimerase